VFGPRQDPDGAYAAVIPRWIAAMIKNQPTRINGDGETSRDFCYIANVVQANLLAASTASANAVGQVYNVALSARTTLNQLFEMLRNRLHPFYPHLEGYKPVYEDLDQGCPPFASRHWKSAAIARLRTDAYGGRKAWMKPWPGTVQA